MMTEAELAALSAILLADIAYMQAANQQRASIGAAVAIDSIYGYAAYQRLEGELIRRGVLPATEDRPT